MTSIKENYRVNASSFENEKWWKDYIAEKIEGYDPDDEFEARMIENTKRNAYLIKYFADDLAETKHLSEDTIQKHVDNIDFYLDYYAGPYCDVDAEGAINAELMDDFMMDWFPRKAMWCSVTSMKTMCTSIRKFYAWMNRNDLISEEQLWKLSQQIKKSRPRWIGSYMAREAYYAREADKLFGRADE